MEGGRWAIFQAPSGRDRAAYPVHFTTAVYTTHLLYRMSERVTFLVSLTLLATIVILAF